MIYLRKVGIFSKFWAYWQSFFLSPFILNNTDFSLYVCGYCTNTYFQQVVNIFIHSRFNISTLVSILCNICAWFVVQGQFQCLYMLSQGYIIILVAIRFDFKSAKWRFLPIPFLIFLEKIGMLSNHSLFYAPLLYKMGTRSYA